jgi:hypothetical protein
MARCAQPRPVAGGGSGRLRDPCLSADAISEARNSAAERAGHAGEREAIRKCKTPPRSDIYRGGVLCSVRERTTRELLRPTNRANWQSRVQVQRSARPRKKTAQSHLRAWAYLCPRRITPSRSPMQRHRPSQFVRHAPSRSLSGRMSVGVKSDPTELPRPKGRLSRGGSRRSGL